MAINSSTGDDILLHLEPLWLEKKLEDVEFMRKRFAELEKWAKELPECSGRSKKKDEMIPKVSNLSGLVLQTVTLRAK